MPSPTSRPRDLLVAVIYFLVLVGYPCVALIKLGLGLGVEARGLAFALRAIVLGISVYVLLRTLVMREFHGGRHTLPIVVFWILYIARAVYDTILTDAVTDTGFDYLTYALGVCLVPMLACYAGVNVRTIGRSRYFVLVALTAVCAGILVSGGATQYIENTGRLGLDTLNPITVGNAAVSLILVAVDIVLWPAGSLVLKAGAAAAMPIALSALTASGSRGPVVAALLLVPALFWRHRQRRLLCLALVCGMGLSVWLGFSVGYMRLAAVTPEEDLFLERTRTDLENLADYPRIRLQRDAIAQFISSPIVGSGLVEENTKEYPHNILVEAFMATGVVGGVALLVFFIPSVAAAARLTVSRERSGVGWVGAIAVQYAIGALLSGGLWSSYVMWCFIAAAVTIEGQVRATVRTEELASDPILLRRQLWIRST